MKKNFVLFVFMIFVNFLFAQDFLTADDAFYFSIFEMNKNSVMSASKLNHPITEKDRITVSKDGHLQANGKRIRIFGTNLSAFPESHEQAEFYAQVLANQGYNCIRFHHTDAEWTNCFFKYTYNENGIASAEINKKRLDDFDYFFNELKKRGIYSNINLLTGRKFSSTDGLPKEVDNTKSFKSNHLLGFWNEKSLNLQKEYAFDLLSHVNPYTKIAYKDDPAVAIVEINNENGLLQGYLNENLDEYKYSGELWQELEDKWNDFLKTQNLSYEKLASIYNKNEKNKKDLIFSSSKWNLEQHQGANATVSKKKNEHEIEIQQNGKENWHVQYTTSNLNIKSEEIYTLKFSAKASTECEIDVSISQAHEPWKNAGYFQNLKLTEEWQDFQIYLTNLLTDENLRLVFGSMGFLQGKKIYIKDVALYEGGNITYVKEGKKSSPTQKTVLLPHFSDYKNFPDEYKNLILNFMWELEQNYWVGMKNYIKSELGTKALLMGTSMGCSTTILQSCFDIIDSHAYWNHPVFPGQDWDMSNYFVKNKNLVKSESDENSLTNCAKYRVFGKPFSVSEYDHPYPNQFSSQMYPMLASYAAFQDWDCIFTFCSEFPSDKVGKNVKINGYFDQSNNPAKSCAAPVAARIFRQFLVKPSEKSIYVNLDEKTERENLYKNSAWSVGSSKIFGLKQIVGLKYQIGIALDKKIPKNGANFLEFSDEILKIEKDVKTAGNALFSDTKEIYWDEKSGVYLVNNDDVSISVISKDSILPEIPTEWKKDGRILPLQKTDDFATFAAVRENSNYMIFACSWSGNKGEQLSEYGKKSSSGKKVIFRDEISLTTNYSFGRGPAQTLGIDTNFETFGEKNYSLFKINLDGNQSELLKSGNNFSLTKETPTLWYFLEAN